VLVPGHQGRTEGRAGIAGGGLNPDSLEDPLLQQLAADPQAASKLPFLTALVAITAGSRDRSLAEVPGLSYDQAAEVLLLIEALEAEAGG
jgi:hypothetical protein